MPAALRFALVPVALAIAACGAKSPLITPDVMTDAAIDVPADVAVDIPADDATPIACTLGATRPCYDGPAGTRGVGLCADGTQRCVMDVAGMLHWNACTGEVLPTTPECDGLDHACTAVPPTCDVMAVCSGASAILLGTSVTLSATASAMPPSHIVSTMWSVVASPPGATYLLATPTATSTTFTGYVAGTYTIQFSAVDDAGHSATCQVMITVVATYLGTEFWAVTTTNSALVAGDVFDFAIVVGNPNADSAGVTVSGGALTTPVIFSVPPHTAITQTLPWVTALSQNSGTFSDLPDGCCDEYCCEMDGSCMEAANDSTSALVTNGAYRIQTTLPVSAYEFNALQYETTRICATGTNSYTNDASLLLPTGGLTGNYVVLSHNAFDGGSFAAIAAVAAGTTVVTVALTAPITGGTGVAATTGPTTQTYTLAQGDVVELITTSSMSMDATYGAEDLTGTVITADHPVAVFAGVDCTNISGMEGVCYACDHLEQQLFPQETWGTDVVVSQLVDRDAPDSPGTPFTDEPFFVRILSRAAGNVLNFIPPSVHPPVMLGAGEFVEFCTTHDFEVLSATSPGVPFLVEQFMVGGDVASCDACTSGTGLDESLGDPSAVLEVPVTQYLPEYVFVVPDTYTRSFANIVAPSGEAILLDGAPLGVPASVIPGTHWSVYRVPVAAGAHTASTTSAAGFALEVLGVAPYTSYAYPGGTELLAGS